MTRAVPYLMTLVIVFAPGCGDTRLSSVVGEVLVEPARVDFSRAFVGYPVSKSVTFTNRSRAGRDVVLEIEPPFRIEGDTTRALAAGETIQVAILFEPDRADTFERRLTVTVESEKLQVSLVGSALLRPDCQPTAPCRQIAFDPDGGTCVESPRPEGTECTSDSPCITNSHCLHGDCIGDAVSCDDANACTTDACDRELGCVHRDDSDSCAAPTDSCKVPFCDPSSGCSITDAADGTSCGKADCETAAVCIAGECKVVPVAEGAACGPDSPCQPKGHCVNKVCLQPPASVLSPVWTYLPTHADTKILRFFGASDALDNLYWAECFDSPTCSGAGCPSTCEVVSSTRDGAIRWRVPARPTDERWNDVTHQMVSGDFVITFVSGSIVEVRNVSDGTLVWSRDIPEDFWHEVSGRVGGDAVAFMKFGSPSADATQVVIPFEGWVSRGGSTVLSAAFVVDLDLQTGAERWNRPIAGHTATSAIDEDGNVYVASQVTTTSTAIPPFALEAWTSQGTPRWSVIPISAFELSVAEGTAVLDGVSAYDTSSGALRWSTLETAASTVISVGESWNLRTNALTQRALDTGLMRWTATFPNTHFFEGRPMITAPSDFLVLAMDPRGPPISLLEQVKSNGDEGFSCPLPAIFNGRTESATLLDQRWVGALNVNQLMAFDVPGLRLAKKGWVVLRGNKGSSGSAR